MLQEDERNHPLCKTTYEKLISTVSGFAFAVDQYLLTPAELHSSATSQPMTDNPAKDMVRYLIQQETDRLNNHTYADEEYTLKLLENGELEKMQEHMKLFRIAYPQIFFSNSRKTDEYMAIASIGIMAHTAIRGGVTSAESFRFLARLFSASEGMTVGQYIRRKKINLAKNMLIYSDRSILDIANYTREHTYLPNDLLLL